MEAESLQFNIFLNSALDLINGVEFLSHNVLSTGRICFISIFEANFCLRHENRDKLNVLY
jgi:hypothetical protein